MYLTRTDDRFDLSKLANSIRESSNFRFAWQFMDCFGADLNASETVRNALEIVAAEPQLQDFLRDSMDEGYCEEFEIEPLHEHASIEQNEDYFLDIMARASLDRLGAYSVDLSKSSPEERRPIHDLFFSVGSYSAFSTQPGAVEGCDICEQYHRNDLFCNWFNDLAWDYLFILTWPESSLLWLGCLTDTD